jgi:hypothetical protein
VAPRVGLMVLVVLIGIEAAMRFVLLPNSRDFETISSFTRRAIELSQKEEQRLAVVGNSAVNAGIDARQLADRLAVRGATGWRAGTLPADDSSMVDWYCITDRYLWNAGRDVDVLVVCFFHDQLADARPSQPGRLAYWFARPAQWPTLFKTSLPKLNDRVDFLFSSQWPSYAVRQRLRERTLKLLVPGYEGFARKLNQTELETAARRAGKSRHRNSAENFHLLKDLIARAKARHTRLIFVAFPRRPGDDTTMYNVSEHALRIISDADMEFVDLREVPGLTREMYRDWIHTTPEGKAVFTQQLADSLFAVLGRHP